MPPPNMDALWSAGSDETVEVNQRALIDKILARYSGEHTIFRELLQNADDAGAQHVQVKLYSQAGWEAHERGDKSTALPDAKHDAISRYVVCNDGIPFRPEDWHRLKKIAEGNPDEDRIGAFGVGFYSLWSVCDDPFVESGSKWMGFYWKDGKDQLVARSGDLPPNSADSAEPSLTGNPWTTFTMALRDPTPFEGPLEFARFLVTSLTFMRTIKRIDMVVDGIKVLEVRKDVKGQKSVTRPGLNNTSTNGMMKVQGVDSTNMVITARVMKWLSATGVTPTPVEVLSKPLKAAGGLLSSFFGRSTPAPSPEPPTPSPVNEDPMDVDVMGREIHTFQADIKVSITSSFSRELERATKKQPPSRMPASLVFSREDESATAADGSSLYDKKASAVFSGLCPPLDGEKSARVFIGQPTSQTTGIGGHLSARFIPTVERESVDLVDKHVSKWNKELLWVGGYLSRLIYELEMAELAQQWSKTTATETAARTQIIARGLYALRFFTFRPTTPSAAIGSVMEAAFFDCARNNSSLPLISTGGVLAVDKVRIPNDELLQFLPDLPVLTPGTLETAQRAIGTLRQRHLLRDIVFEDVVQQLHSRPLTEAEMIACLKWWQDIGAVDGYSPQVRLRLMQAAIVITESGKIIPLAAVKTFINPSTSMIPADMPLPPDTIPFSVTKNLKISGIHHIFGWIELSLPHYVDFLTKPPMTGTPGSDPATDICVSPEFAERVLGVLGRAWPGMSAQKQQATAAILRDVSCIPTKAGFKKPGEAYFEKNLLFDDLPTIAFLKTHTIKGGLESMLLAIGVRRTVDLQLVFSRLIGGGSWTCVDLMKYLVSVKDNLSKEELARLRQTAAFPLAKPESKDAPVTRMKPNQLYEPTDTLRELNLPLLEWPENKWRSNSDEAKMLFDLGLRRFPPIDTLLGLAAGPEPVNQLAFNYLLSNIETHYSGFDSSTFGGVAFIPSTSATGNNTLSRPGEVYTNDACKILGFSVARLPASLPANASKLGIKSDPAMPQLVKVFLQSPERDTVRARAIYEYLASRLGSAQVGAIGPLKSGAWIPVKTEKDFRLARPDEVFLGKDKVDPLYASAFTFVDFGERANMFLHHVGVRSEPSHKDIAHLLLKDPYRMLEAGGLEKYLDQLRIIAAHVKSFDGQTIYQMKTTAFVIGSQLVLKEKRTGENDDDYRREWVLCKASDTVILNNATYSHYFKKYITGAPEERILESFYNTLGAQYIHTKVGLDYITSGVREQPSSEAAANRKHILERLTIFLGQDGTQKAKYSTEFVMNHFEVQEASSIKARYTYRDGRTIHQHVEMLYAMAEAKGRETVLTLSTTAPFDAYDIAYSLVSVLLKTHKTEDVLTLDAILSTPLPLLKKRGFNVDRLLNQQQEERLRLRAEAQKATEAKAAAAVEAREQRANTAVAAAAGKQAMEVAQPSPPPPAPVSTDDAAGNRPDSGIMNVFRRFGRGNGAGIPRRPSNPTPDQTPTPNGFNKSSAGGGGAGGVGPKAIGGPHPTRPSPPTTTARPSDTAQIRNTARAAVQASKPGVGAMTIESTRRNTAVAPESQQQYCDPSAEANIRKAHSPGPTSCEIYLPLDQPEFSGDEFNISQRFIHHILLPLAGVFELQPSVLRVFWDRSGPLIAFNRSGEIFCNARYYNAWHDVSVQQDNKTAALVSWYHSLAHELAHNLESQHNASHEFWFSSILEEYFVKFASLVSNSSRELL